MIIPSTVTETIEIVPDNAANLDVIYTDAVANYPAGSSVTKDVANNKVTIVFTKQVDIVG